MTKALLQQAFAALHPQANRAFVEATKDALRAALAQPEPIDGFGGNLDDAFDAPAPAVPPPIDNRFVAPGCEQFGTRADAESLLAMLRTTLNEYMRLAAPAPAVPDEMSPEFTDTARNALLWVLWHHQGGSSAVGQPIRFALGMDAHERLSEHQIAQAKKWAAATGSTTAEFHTVSAAPAVREPQHTETSRLLANVADAARRLVEHADFQLGGILSADSKAKDIPSKAVSQVKARHLASLRDRIAELDAAHGIGGGGK